MIEVAREAQERLGHTLAAVRLDSGDLEADSRLVRAALDRAGLRETRVLPRGTWTSGASPPWWPAGPHRRLRVGTSLGVGGGSLAHEAEGAPWGGVQGSGLRGRGRPGAPRIKLAGEKSTWPGRKEVYRLGL